MLLPFLLMRAVQAELIYENRAEYGVSISSSGKSEYCETGTCIDGTLIGRPGQCLNWMNLCGDVDPVPRCAANQVLDQVNCAACEAPPSGTGVCYAGSAQWMRNQWRWHCFDCPPGYLGVNLGGCGTAAYWDCQGRFAPKPCIKCSGSDEVLLGNPDDGWYCSGQDAAPACTRPARSDAKTPAFDCQIVSDISRLVGNISTAATFLGALCPTTNTLSLAITAVEAVTDKIGILVSDASSKPAAEASLAQQVDSAIASFVLTLTLAAAAANIPFLGTAATVAELYNVVCDFTTGVGLVTTELSLPLSVAASDCPALVSKRGLIDLQPRQADTQNPCESLLELFPGNVSTVMHHVQDACDSIGTYLPVDVYSNNTLQVLAVAKQQCDFLYHSYNLTLLSTWGSFLDAVKAYQPYCLSNSTISMNSSSIAAQATTAVSISTSVFANLTKSSTVPTMLGISSSGSLLSESIISSGSGRLILSTQSVAPILSNTAFVASASQPGISSNAPSSKTNTSLVKSLSILPAKTRTPSVHSISKKTKQPSGATSKNGRTRSASRKTKAPSVERSFAKNSSSKHLSPPTSAGFATKSPSISSSSLKHSTSIQSSSKGGSTKRLTQTRPQHAKGMSSPLSPSSSAYTTGAIGASSKKCNAATYDGH